MKATISFVTCGSKEEAEKIAEVLVKEKLAACVNLLSGVTSIYFWEGKLNKDQEILLVIKSTTEVADRLTERVKQLHSYDVPEVATFPIDSGNRDYLKWVEGQVS